MNNQVGVRLPWLDIAKGIAMVAVVFSHEFASVKPLVLLCNSFMLPLFFYVLRLLPFTGEIWYSGIFQKKSKNLIVALLYIGTDRIFVAYWHQWH